MAKTSPRKKTKSGKASRTTTRKKSSSSTSSRSRPAKTAAKKKVSTTKRKTKVKAKTKSKSSPKSKTASKPRSKSTTSKKAGASTSRKKAPSAAMKTTTSKKKKAPATTGGKKKTTKKKSATLKTADQKGSSKNKRARSVAEVASAAAADDKGYVFINGRRVRMISTQGVVRRKPTKQAAVESAAAEDVQPDKPLKTHLSRKELSHYRNVLLEKRAEIVGDLDAMETSALRSNGGDISHMPIHMADIGTDTYDQDFTLGMAEAERKQIREIDEALQRIEDKTYGVCLMTGNPIPKARLDAKPWARYTIEAARIVESQTLR